jgi:hypothetical protein
MHGRQVTVTSYQGARLVDQRRSGQSAAQSVEAVKAFLVR